ncbi:MAG: pyridoxal phosphate-dependent aminotransferase [Acidimicrobiia bacterium]|nr:pyridoxal phosphate-dependent aminotransferase [Acidimicrobiia bacterium]
MPRLPHLNARLQGFGTTIFAEMSALAAKTGAINLGQGFPDTDGPPEVSAAAIEAIGRGENQYPPGPGTPDLRQAVAEHQQRFWSMTTDPDTEVLVTAGATEAIAATLLALCEVGDEVIVFDPTYDSYAASIAMAGAKIRPVLLSPDNGTGRYAFDPGELRAAFSARTRLVLLNTPHNPTGKVFTRTELDLVAELCRQHDVVAVTDEVYEHLVFEGTHVPLATLPDMADRTVTISSGGKTFSFTGWKIGWAVASPELITAIRTAKQFLTFVNGAPFQPAIAVGLRLGDSYYEQFVADLRAKRDLLGALLTEAGFTVLEPEGTYFTTVDISSSGGASKGESDGIEFCLGLPERAGVVAVPSQVFYQHPTAGRSMVRFCFAKRDEVLRAAGRRLIDAFAG